MYEDKIVLNSLVTSRVSLLRCTLDPPSGYMSQSELSILPSPQTPSTPSVPHLPTSNTPNHSPKDVIQESSPPSHPTSNQWTKSCPCPCKALPSLRTSNPTAIAQVLFVSRLHSCRSLLTDLPASSVSGYIPPSILFIFFRASFLKCKSFHC